jgi:hypothetical protein
MNKPFNKKTNLTRPNLTFITKGILLIFDIWLKNG